MIVLTNNKHSRYMIKIILWRDEAMLNFLGKGSAFADDNTCAYFKDGKDMILIDFSLEAFPKFR